MKFVSYNNLRILRKKLNSVKIAAWIIFFLNSVGFIIDRTENTFSNGFFKEFQTIINFLFNI